MTSAKKGMKAYPSFEAYLADQSRSHQAIVRKLRSFVRRTDPALVEAVKWGNGCWLNGKKPVAYVYCAPDHVQFGFMVGSMLKDPKKLLQGSGAYVRHVRLFAPSDLDARAFAPLLRQAAKTPYARYD
jgi:hypothetical protein